MSMKHFPFVSQRVAVNVLNGLVTTGRYDPPEFQASKPRISSSPNNVGLPPKAGEQSSLFDLLRS